MEQPQYGMILVPQPPQFRTIFHKSQNELDNDKPAKRKTHLYFPNSMFAILYMKHGDTYTLNRLQVGFSKTPLTGDRGDRLYGLPINNVDDGLNVCLYEHPQATSLKELARKCIELFWSSPFVNYEDNYSHWKDNYSRGFLTKWKKASQEKQTDFFDDKELESAPYIVSVGMLLDTHKTAIGSRLKVLDNITGK